MTKKIKTHILLWVIAYFILFIRLVISNRILSNDTYKLALYYLMIVVFVYLLNLINSRLIKWTIVICIYVMPISILLYFDKPNADFTLDYVITVGAKINMPILPKNTWLYTTHKDYSVRVFYDYLVFFILPILYWAGLYYLSKWLVLHCFTKYKKD